MHAALEIAGLKLSPWKHDTTLTRFERGTMHGLLEILPTTLRIVAIHNDTPGNGQFKPLMVDLEKLAAEHPAPIEVVSIANKNLLSCLRRRGYTLGFTPELGKFARLSPPP